MEGKVKDIEYVLTVYIICFLVGLPFNLVACYAFLKKVRQKPTPTDILLFSLTVSDLLLLFFLIFKIVEAASNMTWPEPLPKFLCPLTNFFFYSSIYLSTLFLMGISVERYLCIAFPVKYKLNRKPTYTIIASVFFLFLACAHCGSIVYAVEYHNVTASFHKDTCYVEFSKDQLKILLPFRLELCIVLFCLPLLITLFCYISVIYRLTTMPNIPPHKKKRAVGLAVATVLNFAIAFAPYNISHIAGYIQEKSPSWREITFTLTTLNTVLDPVIFYFSSTTFRRIFRDCWLGMYHKLCAVCGNNVAEAGAGSAGGLNLQNGRTEASNPNALATQQRSGTTDS